MKIRGARLVVYKGHFPWSMDVFELEGTRSDVLNLKYLSTGVYFCLTHCSDNTEILSCCLLEDPDVRKRWETCH